MSKADVIEIEGTVVELQRDEYAGCFGAIR